MALLCHICHLVRNHWSDTMHRIFALALFLALPLAACAPTADEAATTGKIKAVGKDSIVIEDAQNVIIVSDIDPAELKKLSRGQSVRLLDSNRHNSADIDEILLPDGTHIPIAN